MKIKMLISMAGHRFGVKRGDVINPDDEEAQRLIDAGYAEKAHNFAKETAVWGHGEEAVAAAPETTSGGGGVETR